MSLNRDMTDSKEKKNQKSVRHDFLRGQVNAAEAIMRAAQFEINAKKLPDVKTCKNSVQAWKQFTMYFNTATAAPASSMSRATTTGGIHLRRHNLALLNSLPTGGLPDGHSTGATCT